MVNLKMQQIDYKIYYDKILAGWIGKSLGGIVGAPYENHKQFNAVTQDTLWPKVLYPNDDLDIQVVWLEALQELGLYFDSTDLARFWQKRCFYICCEYGIFINNLEHGIYPPLSGKWNNQFFKASEGCPIRSEIWGFISAGNPQLAAEYAGKDGCLDHGQQSVEIEKFLAAAAALAFFNDDLNQILAESSQVVPPDSAAVEVFNFTREVCRKYPNHFDAWRILVRRYGNRDASNAKMNLAIVLMALYLGGKDFKHVMEICVKSGWDADCSAATAGALFGTLYGTGFLPEDWQLKMGKTLICACEIPHQFTALTDFAAETAALGVEMSLSRNSQLKILNAPQVTVRQKPAAKISMQISYADDRPVLYPDQVTAMKIVINNPLDQDFSGWVEISAPEDLEIAWSNYTLKIPANSTKSLDFFAKLKNGAEFLNDKNLFQAELFDAANQKYLTHIFGLEAARIWKVYGPYWDMWDKDKHKVCPYQNDDLKCNPSAVPDCLDYFNHYVRLEHPYLDEEQLLKSDIETELPFDIAVAEDKITNRDLSDFVGECCYYLVRTVKSKAEIKAAFLGIGHTTPYKIWFDGKWIETNEHYSGWAPEYDDRLKVDLNGKPQRLIIKVVSQVDNFALSHAFVKVDPTKKYAVSPMINDIAYLL